MKHVSLWTVLKLRVRLWWKFGFDEWAHGVTSHHRLKIRWNARFQTWAWVCVVRTDRYLGMHDGEYNLGPLQQWSLQEALSLAARKAEWILNPDLEPVKDPEPNPPVPKHNKVYRLMDGGQIRIECQCGWIGSSRCHSETTAQDWCTPCALAEQSFLHHEIAVAQETVAQ